ncbi:S41 family peptidase, partial [Enterobacter hormaechei]|uniref:S41 family peptidase n=1 Tax=Enterobacter hormaechei TaxID=158836 RepID=UPI00203CFAA2
YLRLSTFYPIDLARPKLAAAFSLLADTDGLVLDRRQNGGGDDGSADLLVRTLLGAAEAGFFPGMIYLTSQWFPQQNRASIM